MISVAPAPDSALVTMSTCSFSESMASATATEKPQERRNGRSFLCVAYADHLERLNAKLGQRGGQTLSFIDAGRKYHHRLAVESNVQPQVHLLDELQDVDLRAAGSSLPPVSRLRTGLPALAGVSRSLQRRAVLRTQELDQRAKRRFRLQPSRRVTVQKIPSAGRKVLGQ